MIWLRIMLKIILVFSLILKSSILNVDFIIILADFIKQMARLQSYNPRLKNVVPNFYQILELNLLGYPEITYRPQKGIEKITQILLACCKASVALSPERLQSFRKMVRSIIDSKMDFHQRHMDDKTEFRKKSIQVLQNIYKCCMKVIEKGLSCLEQTLECLFNSENSEIGGQGRQIIQRHKIKRAMAYIQQKMANLDQPQMDKQNRSQSQPHFSNSSENQSLRSQSSSQLSFTSMGALFEEMCQKDVEVEKVEKSQGELMVQIEGENFIDFSLKSPEDQALLRVCDLLERKQEEEIKYMLLCKRSTTANVSPANQQADIQES